MAPEPGALLEIGYVAKAHGLTGEVGVRTYDPASTALDEVARVLVRPRLGEEKTLVIESVRETPKEVLVVFEGVRGREAGEALVGAKVLVYREDLDSPEEGEFFQGDLIGLTAYDEQGAMLGTVEEVWETGPVPNLVIRSPGKDELVVPFAEEFVPLVDLAAGKLVIKPPQFSE